MTHGDHPQAWNRAVTPGIVGGLTLGNTLLLGVREHQARVQCIFNLDQQVYPVSEIQRDVRLMGLMLDWRAATRRYRASGR